MSAECGKHGTDLHYLPGGEMGCTECDLDAAEATIAQQQATIAEYEQLGAETGRALVEERDALQQEVDQQQARIEALEEQKRLLQVAFDLNLVTGVKFHEMVEALAAERERAEKAERERGNFYIDWGIANGSLKEALKDLQAERERGGTKP